MQIPVFYKRVQRYGDCGFVFLKIPIISKKNYAIKSGINEKK